jgi:sec-independent protein translocase protein TatA
MGLSWSHILIVLVLFVLLFGRGKISELMGDVAQGIKSFKKGMAEDEEKPAEPAKPSPRSSSTRRKSEPARPRPLREPRPRAAGNRADTKGGHSTAWRFRNRARKSRLCSTSVGRSFLLSPWWRSWWWVQRTCRG